MRIGNVIIDTDNMKVEDVDILIRELKGIRARKADARSFRRTFRTILTDMKEKNFDLCSKTTGEVFKLNDWVIYDSVEHAVHGEEIE